MKNVHLRSSFLALLWGFALHAVHGAVFNYSYTFADGVIASGSVTGTQNGQLVEGISSISLFFNGAPVPGSIFSSQYDPNLGYLNGPVVSFNVLQNNFIFANSHLAGGDFGYDSVFYLLNAAVSPFGAAAAEAFSDPLIIASLDLPTAANRWSLTAASPSTVPDAGATVLLLGTAMLGAAWLRRKRV